MQSWLPHLLHLSDPTLPIGAYTHSNGLETYVQQGLITNGAEAALYIRNMLEHNLPYNDALFASLAYRSSSDTAALALLEDECTALKSPMELRQASQKLGIRLLKLFGDKHSGIKHYCLVYGVYASSLGIPLEDALTAFYYNAATSMVTNCVKLVPLGQQEGQQILFSLLPMLPQLVETTLKIPRELAGRCSCAFDIRSMQHERLYSRLYMS